MRLPPLSDELKQQAIEAYEKAGGNKAQAARDLGIPVATFKDRYKAATLHKSVARLEPFIPDGQKLRGVSSLYKVDTTTGEKTEVMQWVKTNEDLDRQIEIIRNAAEALKADIPKEPPQAFTGQSQSDLLSLYILTDYHIGQMSWVGETGEDWNTDKSCTFLVDWFSKAIAAAPPSEVGVLCQLGDFLHFDGLEAVTPTSKHVLDADKRYANVVGAAIKAIRRIVSMMLTKHEKVHIIMAEGNHDLASSVWLRALFATLYENEPRITVDNSHLPYYAYEWGATSLFFHHGHKKKMEQVSGMFTGMYREMFGRTKYSYAHMGHYHHIASKEDGNMVIRQHRTMAVKDAHSARGGYLSDRSASVITYSQRFGHVGEITITPEMVQ